MLALFFGLGVLPLLTLGVVSYRQSMDAVEELLATETAFIALRTAGELESRYARYQSDLLLLAGNLETLSLFRSHYGNDAGSGGEVPASRNSYLDQVWEQFQVSYRWIELLDTSGAVVYRLGETGGDLTSISPISEASPEEGFRFTHPIEDPTTSGDLGEVVALASTHQVLPSDVLSQTFGRSGYSVVLDLQADRVIHHPRRAILQARASNLVGPEGWHVDPGRLAASEGSFTFTANDSTRVASFVTTETPLWTVLSTTAVEEFSGPFARTRRLFLILVGLVTAIVSLAFLLMTNRATRSLESLTRAADAVASGNYSPALPPSGSDEVGRLSSAFGTMANRVDETLRRIQESRHMAIIGQFTSRLSHEIRNPLTSVKLNLQRIERHAERGGLPDECLGPLEISLGEVDRLDRVVRGVLSLARTGVPGTEPCSVHAVVHRAITVVGPQLEGQGIEIEQDLRAGRDRIVGNEEALQGVFVNLILNGAEAMPGGGRIRVSSGNPPRSEENSGSIQIEVKDHGPGIDPSLREKIFEPFFSTKKEGTGFGLSVALSTVEDHGGTLRLEVALEGEVGAVFVVELPLSPGERGVESG
jgi:signal transduction histidine kinase